MLQQLSYATHCQAWCHFFRLGPSRLVTFPRELTPWLSMVMKKSVSLHLLSTTTHKLRWGSWRPSEGIWTWRGTFFISVSQGLPPPSRSHIQNSLKDEIIATDRVHKWKQTGSCEGSNGAVSPPIFSTTEQAINLPIALLNALAWICSYQEEVLAKHESTNPL